MSYKLFSFVLTAALLFPALSFLPHHKTEPPLYRSKPYVAETSANPQLPSLRLYDVNGTTTDLSYFKGKKVFVNIWASWCPPCRSEMPSIEKLYQSVDTGKVAFVLISFDNRFETAKRFVAGKNWHLPIYYPAGIIPDLFNVRGIPATFIFDEKGELVQQIEGGENYNTKEYKTLLNGK